jgi:hypothetical protein
VPALNGTFIASDRDGPALTLMAVFVIYGVPLVLVLLALRNR